MPDMLRMATSPFVPMLRMANRASSTGRRVRHNAAGRPALSVGRAPTVHWQGRVGSTAFPDAWSGADLVADALPEVIAARVWERRQAGEPCVDISLWLARIGYRVGPDEVAVIAAQYAQQQEAATRTPGT